MRVNLGLDVSRGRLERERGSKTHNRRSRIFNVNNVNGH